MVTQKKETFDKFEFWDGGHCYLRFIRLVDMVECLRFPPRASVEEIVALAEWAKRES